MQELEEKFRGVQVENESLKLAVAKADEQELRLKTERNELHAEIAALRAKVKLRPCLLLRSCTWL